MTIYDFDPPQSFYRAMAKHCRCCLECSSAPCYGVLAGGMCDEYCHCDDDYLSADDEDRCDCGNVIEGGERYCNECVSDTLGEP